MLLARCGFINLASVLDRFELLYFSILGIGPFAVWSFLALARFRSVQTILARDFEELGLKTVKGRIPQLLRFHHVDDTSRVLKIAMNGVPFDEFKSRRTALASKFGIFITSMEEKRTEGTLKIQFTPFEIPSYVKMETPGELRNFTIRVGYGAGNKPLDVSLRDVSHWLVGGSTKMGKSTFFRQAITTLLFGNSPHIRIVFIDLKDGLEADVFKNLDRVTTYKDASEAVVALDDLYNEMKSRMKLFGEVGAQNIDVYHEKIKELNADADKKARWEMLPRVVVFIDEAFELFMVGSKADGKKSADAKRLCIKLAAQGRAAGIHLIIGTQRPDASTIDTQIKGNLTGRLCFHTADNPSSMVILDSVRASDLSPKDKGRAVWKSGPDIEEIQTPDFPTRDAELFLKPLRKAKEKDAGNAGTEATPLANEDAVNEAAAIAAAR
jgi:DNA segregation ATPase FtsK/SpoIIIE, S-DNA-T family